jgi:hypothetical protein
MALILSVLVYGSSGMMCFRIVRTVHADDARRLG